MTRKATLFGIRPDAIPAWLSLGIALERMADDGRKAICATRPDQWSEDATPTARSDAVEACSFCPAKNACGAFADANQERSGVWGGVDRTPPGRRTAAA